MMTANPKEYLGTKFFDKLIGGHREWLMGFDKVYLETWQNLFTKNNSEAALCEAATRKLLFDHGCNVKPFEDPSSGGVDFKCSKNGNTFYAEATCITKNVASDKTGLTHLTIPNEATDYAYLTRTICQELSNKTSQCSGLDAPCIVVIGTCHFQAGCLCFDDLAAEELLTGKTHITKRIDRDSGKAVGESYELTQLESAAFIRPNAKSPHFIEHARCPISAVLLCAFGTDPMHTAGILHPDPTNIFNRALLPDITFCRLVDGYARGPLEVEWI
ncbi:MAG: hypothetical protein IH624_05220 [Phycisphaerae bacterium]|nr:hypothetical protein [Phycisphaerae bacterium]